MTNNAAIKLCKKDYYICPICNKKIFITKNILSSCRISDYTGKLFVNNHEVILDKLPKYISKSSFICKECKKSIYTRKT